MRFSLKTGWFLAFAAVFAALAGFVFWGTWSQDVFHISPDDGALPISSYSDVLNCYFRKVLTTGKVLPTDILWDGLLISPCFTKELKYVLAVFFAALGLVYFLRGRGLSRPASYGAGLLLGFCGYWLTLFSAGHGGWFVWMTYGVFAFGLADRAVREGRFCHWLLLGLIMSWAGFNQQDLWLLFSVFTAVYFFWCCVRERKLPWKGALISLAVFIAVGLPNFKDTIQNTLKGRVEQIARDENVSQKGANETDKRWEFVTNWSMPVEDTLEFFDARVHGDTSCPFVLSINARDGIRPYTGALGRPMNAAQGNYRQHSLYVGWVTCLLALAGVISMFFGNRRSRSEIAFFVIAALVFYSLSLGRYFEPAYRVIFALPFGDLIRCPVKWHHLTELCIAVLAAYGIDAIRKTLDKVKVLEKVGGLGAVVVCAAVLLGALNLAAEAKRYCAPVNVAAARRTNSLMQMTILPRQQFQNPQVAAMVRAGRIVSIANYLGNPDYFVVGVLEPFKQEKLKCDPVAIGLGCVSLLSVLGVFWLVLKRKEICAAGL